MSVNNLRAVLDQALPYEFELGVAAYTKYNEIMQKLAEKCGCTTKIASAVFAALSPNNNYYGNLRDAHTLLTAVGSNKKISDFVVCTYGHNKRKAWKLAHGEEPLTLLVANKTRNFYQNVYDPKDPNPVTVDGHILNVWRGKRENLTGLKFPPRLYAQVAADVRAVASQCAILPCEAQAVIWQTWRRMHGIKTTAQTEFWDAELLAARLGFHPKI